MMWQVRCIYVFANHSLHRRWGMEMGAVAEEEKVRLCSPLVIQLQSTLGPQYLLFETEKDVIHGRLMSHLVWPSGRVRNRQKLESS